MRIKNIILNLKEKENLKNKNKKFSENFIKICFIFLIFISFKKNIFLFFKKMLKKINFFKFNSFNNTILPLLLKKKNLFNFENIKLFTKKSNPAKVAREERNLKSKNKTIKKIDIKISNNSNDSTSPLDIKPKIDELKIEKIKKKTSEKTNENQEKKPGSDIPNIKCMIIHPIFSER